MTIELIFLIIAIVLFSLAATGRVNNVAVNLIAAGLACCVIAVLVPIV